jgi:FAD/FMN-containing dehydrogenase
MRMTEAQHEDALRTLEQALGDRLKRGPAQGDGSSVEGALASVLPMNAEEVRFIAEVARRFSVPLVALGGGTTSEVAAEKGSILIRFDLMRRTRIPAAVEPWIETEPGTSWLQLEDELRVLGRGLAVYPTSAPRATIGGWLAMDGLGVGSFEYGWLRENVLSASVVMPGGELVEVSGEEVRSVVGPESGKGIVVGARLRTRRADDLPCAFGFAEADDLAQAVAQVFDVGVPLWHLGFLNAQMANARNLGEELLLFGAYPAERAAQTEEALREVTASHHGRVLSSADAYRVWGERFFPVTPSRPSPVLMNFAFVTVSEIPEVLERLTTTAVQGTVARTGEVFVLAFDPHEHSSTH